MAKIKTLWPSFADGSKIIATNPTSWFVVAMFILTVFAFHRPSPKVRNKINPQKRDFVETSPDYLMDFYSGRAAVQGDKLAEPYIGKWLKVAEKVHNVMDTCVLLRNDKTYRDIWLYYGTDQKEAFHLLQLGRQVTAIGRIRRIAQYGIDLAESELISSK